MCDSWFQSVCPLLPPIRSVKWFVYMGRRYPMLRFEALVGDDEEKVAIKLVLCCNFTHWPVMMKRKSPLGLSYAAI
jgi:hypothetical protein